MEAQETAYENALRSIVKTAIRSDDHITIRIARDNAEKELGLESGFFKNDAVWNEKSKQIISSALVDSDEENETNSTSPALPNKNGTKRSSEDADSPPAKRVKKQEQQAAQKKKYLKSLNDKQVRETTKPDTTRNKKAKPITKTLSDSDDSDVQDEAELGDEASAKGASSDDEDETLKDEVDKFTSKEQDDGDESDMSVLIDDPPPKKKRQKADTASKKNTKTETKGSAKTKTKSSLSPDEETIKTLQSQLLKCGVRKLWHRELAHCNTSKEKIRHLKEMLNDVGMTGRFNAVKAAQIKEARELAADVEAAQGFEKTWGSEATTGRPKRTSAKQSHVIDDESDREADAAPVEAGTATGLVDFGDSGDEYSE